MMSEIIGEYSEWSRLNSGDLPEKYYTWRMFEWAHWKRWGFNEAVECSLSDRIIYPKFVDQRKI